ncbi:MAG: PDZ domain-containing protein [Eggerthellaceae bacterium]|nr:PDZ domain-containing protein [Eggerthellaceae bacterium]
MASRRNTNRAAARTRKIRARNFRFIKIFTAIIALIVAFALGFALRGHTHFLSSLGLPSSITGIDQTSKIENTTTSDDVMHSLSARVKEVDTLLNSDSLDTYPLDVATDAVLTAIAEASEDPYMRYYSNERYTELLNQKDEGYAGIGVLFSEHNGQAYVVDVFEGSDAQEKGVEEGDFVVSVDADSSQTWSRAEVTARLAQAAGSEILITWRRPDTPLSDNGAEFSTTLECKEYDEPNVTTEYDNDKHVGYIKIRQLTENSASLTKKAIEQLTKKGAKAFVLDLCDNPGGYLSQAVDVASLFMKSGTVVQLQTTNGISAKAASGQSATDAPLVVLVNKNTAAGAEVIAAALKESQRASELVGGTTLGKGSVQVVSQLSFGGALRYTAAFYLTPEGHSIDKVGVTPTHPLEASQSTQKSYAKELAASLIPQE